MERTRRTNRETRFESLVLPARGALLTHAKRLTRDPTEAEDLVQETLLRAYTHRDTLESSGSTNVRPYLHAILRNLFINTHRRRVRTPQSVSWIEEQGDELTLAAPGPERMTEQRMHYSATLRAVAALPETYRTPVVLAGIEGMDYETIARQLDLPPGTVRSRISRGRERLRRALYAWRDEIPA